MEVQPAILQRPSQYACAMNTSNMSRGTTSATATLQEQTLCSHLLKLHFPATELLPPGKLPYTQPPVVIGYRERPSLGSYHLTSSHLDYFTKFSTSIAASVPDPPTSDTGISVCVSRLAEAPGVSNLLAVSFFGEDDILTRLCLETLWITSEGKVQEKERHFEACSTEWYLRLSFADKDPTAAWMFLMNDLMLGATDRAVLHRLQKMEAYDKRFSDKEQEFWPSGWDEMSFPTSNQLLANNIEHMYVETGVGSVYAPMVILHAYGDDDVIKARLPCGHHFTFTAGELKQLSEDECIFARCEVEGCQKRIMTKHDDQLRALVAERYRRDKWAFEQIDWERLDHEVKSSGAVAKVSGAKLYRSLELALDSMRGPESTTPASLDLTQYQETAIICGHLKSILDSAATTIEMSSEAILEELSQQTTDAVRAASIFKDENILALVLPPGLNEFLYKWLTRTVNHAIVPRLSNEVVEDDTEVERVARDLQSFELAGGANESED